MGSHGRFREEVGISSERVLGAAGLNEPMESDSKRGAVTRMDLSFLIFERTVWRFLLLYILDCATFKKFTGKQRAIDNFQSSRVAFSGPTIFSNFEIYRHEGTPPGK